jgi:hypothetical protein
MFNFFHRMKLTPIDPLGDGLRELIEKERLESDAIQLDDTLDEETLDQYWKSVEDTQDNS